MERMELSDAFDHLYSTYFGDNQHEREEIENLPRLLEDKKCFIDVGASLGMFTYFANEAMTDSLIIAVEADPDRYEELAKNCQKWEETGSNTIRCVHAAAGDSREPITFYKTGSQISGGFFPVNERSDAYQEVEVPQILLDDLREDGVPTLVKIDVEGAEFRVMQGAADHIEHGDTEFLIEMHWWGDRDQGYTTLDLLRDLRKKDLSIRKTVKPHTSNYHVAPATPSVKGGYLRVAPLLVAKTVYGKYLPESVRNMRERRLNRRRQAKHLHQSGD